MTHSFHGREGGILDARDRILPEVRRAVENGILLDVGHGAGSFPSGQRRRLFLRASCRGPFQATFTKAMSTALSTIWRRPYRSFSIWV
jgi:hypothetical protein